MLIFVTSKLQENQVKYTDGPKIVIYSFNKDKLYFII